MKIGAGERAVGIQRDLAVLAVPSDERVWVPQAPDVWFRPLFLNTVSGGWCNLLRVRKAGILHRHRHPMIVTGYVLKGRWKYLEHDWVAEAGSFVYEPPVEPPGPDAADPVRELTQRCTDVLEMYVRRHPHLWLWMHRRWRDHDTGAAPVPGMFPAAVSDEREETADA